MNRGGTAGRHGPNGHNGLDAVDKQIIEQLQREGRRPYTQVAQAIGLSEAAVRQRVQRMIDAGVVRIVAVTDPAAVGLGRMAMVGIGVEGDARKVAEMVAEFPEVQYVVLTAGSHDLLIEVVTVDDDGLLDLMNTKIRSVEGVRTIQVYPYLRVVKQTYQWGAS